MAAVLLASAAVLMAGCTLALASVARLHGTVVGPPGWAGSQALVAVDVGKSTVVELVEPQTGESRELAALAERLREARALSVGMGFVFEGISANYGGTKYEPGYIGEHELLFEQPASPLRCVARLFQSGCALPNLCVFGSTVVSGTLLAYPSCERGGIEEAGTVLFNPTSSQTQLVPQIALPLSLAGPWLVGLAPGWDPNRIADGKAAPVLVERNLLTGSEPVRLPLAPWSHPASEPREALRTVAAVEETGTIVYALAAGDDTALWTASPSQPIPRRILTIHASLGWLKELPLPLVLREGRIAFPDAEGHEYGPREIAVATLAGVRLGSLRVLAQDGFDYDGTHVLASSTPCGKSFLLTWAPGEPHPIVPGNGCGTARLARLRLTSGRLLFDLRCPQASAGCETSQIIVKDGPISLTEEGEQLMPGEGEHLALPLAMSARRWLQRHPGAKLTITWGQHSRRRETVSHH
jgi:hypothetical protein